MQKPSASRVRASVIRRVAIAILALVLVGIVGFTGYVGVVGAEDFLHPARSADCRTPAYQFGWTYEAINYDLTSDAALEPTRVYADEAWSWQCNGEPASAGTDVRSSDGQSVAGWYIPAASGAGPGEPTLLLVHGRSSNKSEYLRYAEALHQDFNIVVMDLRNHGQSSVSETTLGVREQSDVKAILDWLDRTKRPRWIGAIGSSLGAASILATAVTDDRLRALVLDSMHADVVTLTGCALESWQHLPAQPGAWAITTIASLRLGVDVGSVDPVRMIGRLAGQPVLLLHGGADLFDPPELSAERNRSAALEAGVAVKLWYCPGAEHESVRDTCPGGWDAQVLEFLAGAMGG